MKSKWIMGFFLSIMGLMVVVALIFPDELKAFLDRPSMYPHILFLHILCTTLFFTNAVVGILWELRSLASGRKDIILHTYNTVAWLDARFSSPLIVLSVLSGIMLSIIYGDIWQIGWLSSAFFLFILSGIVWVISDIPTQYRIKNHIAGIEPDAADLPPALMRLLKLRFWISLAGVTPLVFVFILMIYKPDLPSIAG